MTAARDFLAEVNRRAWLAHPGQSPEDRARRNERIVEVLANHIEAACSNSAEVEQEFASRARWLRCLRTNAPTELALEDSA